MNKLHLCLLAGSLLLINGCNKNEYADCGCGEGSEVVFTIEDSDEQEGYLYRSTAPDIPNFPDYKFGIWFSEDVCINCVHAFLICNNSFISGFGEIPAYPGVKVKFSGKAKDLCEDPDRLADYTYNHIIFTRVELK
jgi:hypothetical protein